MLPNYIKTPLPKADSKHIRPLGILVYLENGKFKKIIVHRVNLTPEAMKRKIKKVLNKGKGRLPKNSQIVPIDSSLIVDESSALAPAKIQPKEIKNPTAKKLNSAVSTPVPISHRVEREKTKEYETKLKHTIQTLKADLHHCRKENSEFRKRIKEKNLQEVAIVKPLKQIKISEDNEKKITQQLWTICVGAIQSCLEMMSIQYSEDHHTLIGARVKKVNSLIEIFEILGQLSREQKVRWDRVSENKGWFKIRGSKNGHFGDDSRIRIYFHPSYRKLCTYYKADDKNQKIFERNLPKVF